MAIGERTGAYSIVWTPWYTYIMSNALLPQTLEVFVIGSTPVYCYDVRLINDTKKYYVHWIACRAFVITYYILSSLHGF